VNNCNGYVPSVTNCPGIVPDVSPPIRTELENGVMSGLATILRQLQGFGRVAAVNVHWPVCVIQLRSRMLFTSRTFTVDPYAARSRFGDPVQPPFVFA
jgi:hypothetical protein